MSYVHNHLQLLAPDKSREIDDRHIIATDRDRIDVELEPYITEEDIIMDLNKLVKSFKLCKMDSHGANLINTLKSS